MTWQIAVHRTSRCATLRSGLWRAEGEARALCLFLPGLGDFLEKRAALAARLAEAGHDVLSLDWCGQGASGHLASAPRAAHARDFGDYLEDALEILAERGSSRRPLWLLGYSMGATVGLLGLGSGRLQPSAVVLVSPMLRFRLSWSERLARGLASVAVMVGRGTTLAPGEDRPAAMGLADADATDAACRLRAEAQARDAPDLTRVGATWGWTQAALNAMPRARRTAWRDGPALVVTAARERSVDLSPVPALARRLGAEILVLDGGHDLFLAGPEVRSRLHHAIEAAVAPALGLPAAAR